MSLATGQTIVVAEPMYMFASITERPDGTMFAEARVSHVVERTDPIYQPWMEAVRHFCFTKMFEEEFEDEEMMQGGGVRRSARLYKVCPGDSYQHNCIVGRSTAPMMISAGKV